MDVVDDPESYMTVNIYALIGKFKLDDKLKAEENLRRIQDEGGLFAPLEKEDIWKPLASEYLLRADPETKACNLIGKTFKIKRYREKGESDYAFSDQDLGFKIASTIYEQTLTIDLIGFEFWNYPERYPKIDFRDEVGNHNIFYFFELDEKQYSYFNKPTDFHPKVKWFSSSQFKKLIDTEPVDGFFWMAELKEIQLCKKAMDVVKQIKKDYYHRYVVMPSTHTSLMAPKSERGSARYSLSSRTSPKKKYARAKKSSPRKSFPRKSSPKKSSLKKSSPKKYSPKKKLISRK